VAAGKIGLAHLFQACQTTFVDTRQALSVVFTKDKVATSIRLSCDRKTAHECCKECCKILHYI